LTSSRKNCKSRWTKIKRRNEREDDHERIGKKKRTRRKDEKRERRLEEVELKS